MKKHSWIPIGFLTLVLVAGFIILQSSTRRPAAPSKPAKDVCKRNPLAKCSLSPATVKPSDMLMESVSRQFLMIW